MCLLWILWIVLMFVLFLIMIWMILGYSVVMYWIDLVLLNLVSVIRWLLLILSFWKIWFRFFFCFWICLVNFVVENLLYERVLLGLWFDLLLFWLRWLNLFDCSREFVFDWYIVKFVRLNWIRCKFLSELLVEILCILFFWFMCFNLCNRFLVIGWCCFLVRFVVIVMFLWLGFDWIS